MSNKQFIAEVETIIQFIPNDNVEDLEVLKRAIDLLRIKENKIVL